MKTPDAHPPLATYRLQLSAAFDFDAAAKLVPYLAQLGVSHLYLSPILQAVPGSTHGYDVTDHGRISDDLGGREAFERLSAALREHGMGLVADIVPNHMGISPRNRWWWDVLRHGRDSRFAHYFDIDWQPPQAHLRGKILLPVLGDELPSLLAAGEITVEHDDESQPLLRYHDHAFPLSEASRARFAAQLLDGSINRDPDALARLIEMQAYRLAHWRAANRELNYRRFFAVNELVAVRVEDPQVFTQTHRLLLELVDQGKIDGLRIDHPDGLRDPATYLERLREAAPRAWIIVEKILEAHETLPRAWPIDGTTGYDALNRIQGLFIDPDGEEAITAAYRSFTGVETSYDDLLYHKKLLVIDSMFGGELDRLTALLGQRLAEDESWPATERERLREAVREMLACFPVYRTYPRPGERLHDADHQAITRAVALAEARRPQLDARLLNRVGDLLKLRTPGQPPIEFAARFAQLSGPVMAKGAEDTAFYVFNRLIALNEVGGDPGRWGMPVEAFHRGAAATQRDWPRTMLAGSTHDTKRSEDVRARLCVLSEIPERWAEAVGRWRVLNETHRRADQPDRNTEHLLYQTLVGAWPIDAERALAYMQKATREAAVHTSWSDPDRGFEDALEAFVTGVLNDPAFVADLRAFVEPLVYPGRVNALSQTLVRLTSPGVPDTYQGCELWDLSLVDPDNRRPIDFDLRRRLASDLRHATAEEAMRRLDEGMPKLLVIQRGLETRRQHAEAFGPAGSYEPLAPRGAMASRAVAFVRGGRALTIAPRLAWSLRQGWGDTTIDLPPGDWRNVFTNELRHGTTSVGDLLRAFPVALLVKE